jgi:hypothetical protein
MVSVLTLSLNIATMVETEVALAIEEEVEEEVALTIEVEATGKIIKEENLSTKETDSHSFIATNQFSLLIICMHLLIQDAD